MSADSIYTLFDRTYDCNKVHPGNAFVQIIREGGRFRQKALADLFIVYREWQTYLWPDDVHHDWSDLVLRSLIGNRYTFVLGPKDSSKTRSLAKFALQEYWLDPERTLVLLSSTTLEALEKRIWGDMKDLFKRARSRWPMCPGNPVDSYYGIFTDDVRDEAKIRDIRRGIVCVPVFSGEHKWRGMANWVGIKQKRRRVFADELALYPRSYTSTFANLDGGDFKFGGSGNPIPDGNALDVMSEPPDGWDSQGDITVTTTWRTAKWEGLAINLVGPDSPAVRFPGKYPFLIGTADINRIIRQYGKDSEEYWNQALGVRPPDVSLYRVMSRDIALQNHAMEPITWRGSPTTRLYAIDAGYGGDRCTGRMAEFGMDQNDKLRLYLHPPPRHPGQDLPQERAA